MTVEESRRAAIAALDRAIPELRKAEEALGRQRAKLERERIREQGLLNRMLDETKCQHNPSRCNGGAYDGCACGPKTR